MKLEKHNLDGKKDSIEVLDKIFSAKINKKNCGKKNRKKFDVSLTLIISASGKARYFSQKSKLIYIEKSKRWAQSRFHSSNRLEKASKKVSMF